MNASNNHSISEPSIIKREAGLLIGIASLVVFLLWGGDCLAIQQGLTELLVTGESVFPN